jgi:hypothetical protein
MGYRPEKEKDGKAGGQGAHHVDGFGGSQGVVSEEDNENPPHDDEEGGSGRVRNLQFIAGAYELPAVPEGTAGLCGHDIYRARYQGNDPTGDVIDFLKRHVMFFDFGFANLTEF